MPAKDFMLYIDKRPANPFAKPNPLKRFHQVRLFDEPAKRALRHLDVDLDSAPEEARDERIFVLPGRRDVVVKLIGETFAMRRKIKEERGMEVWEETAKAELPLRRSVVAMVGAHIPHMRSALSSFQNSDTLAKGLSRRARVYDAKTTVKEVEIGEVTAYVTRQDMEDGTVESVVFRSDNGAALEDFINALPVETENQNIGDVLLS